MIEKNVPRAAQILAEMICQLQHELNDLRERECANVALEKIDEILDPLSDADRRWIIDQIKEY